MDTRVQNCKEEEGTNGINGTNGTNVGISKLPGAMPRFSDDQFLDDLFELLKLF